LVPSLNATPKNRRESLQEIENRYSASSDLSRSTVAALLASFHLQTTRIKMLAVALLYFFLLLRQPLPGLAVALLYFFRLLLEHQNKMALSALPISY
jgi:hypothetical protein